jgi:ATP-binding cassette subfamily B protein
MQSALVSSDRIFEILDTNNTVENFATGAALKKLSGEIEFRDVWFAYNGENWVLRGVSFKINPGESVAFVGPTGSGKSTIISLITRF